MIRLSLALCTLGIHRWASYRRLAAVGPDGRPVTVRFDEYPRCGGRRVRPEEAR